MPATRNTGITPAPRKGTDAMRLSTRGRYAVMAMVEMAGREEHGADRPVSLAEIAAAQMLSLAYLEQLFARLRRAGLVASARGPGGGYRLARPAAAIAIAEIVEAVDEPINATRCEEGSPGCLAGAALPHARPVGRAGRADTLVSGRHDPGRRGGGAGARPRRRAPSGGRDRAAGRGGAGTLTDPSLYLDANASEPLRPEARAAVLEALELPGNPSAVHADGRAARRLLERARAQVAARFGARPGEVVFTSGGTESDALAIRALGAGRRVLAGATEHAAVLACLPAGAALLPVRPDGTLDLAALEAALDGGPPALVCLMLANNETGVLHPLDEAAALCRRHGALLHVDAAQAAGRIPVSLEALGADSLAVSGHKLGGPKGAGP